MEPLSQEILPRTVKILLEAKAVDHGSVEMCPEVGVNRGDTVEWILSEQASAGASGLAGLTLTFVKFEPASNPVQKPPGLNGINPFKKAPTLAGNVVSPDTPSGRYTYEIRDSNNKVVACGTLKIPCDPPEHR